MGLEDGDVLHGVGVVVGDERENVGCALGDDAVLIDGWECGGYWFWFASSTSNILFSTSEEVTYFTSG